MRPCTLLCIQPPCTTGFIYFERVIFIHPGQDEGLFDSWLNHISHISSAVQSAGGYITLHLRGSLPILTSQELLNIRFHNTSDSSSRWRTSVVFHLGSKWTFGALTQSGHLFNLHIISVALYIPFFSFSSFLKIRWVWRDCLMYSIRWIRCGTDDAWPQEWVLDEKKSGGRYWEGDEWSYGCKEEVEGPSTQVNCPLLAYCRSQALFHAVGELRLQPLQSPCRPVWWKCWYGTLDGHVGAKANSIIRY